MQIQIAGPYAHIDAAYNPEVAIDEAGLGIYQRDDLNNHSIFIQASAKNVHSSLQAEALGLVVAAPAVKALN